MGVGVGAEGETGLNENPIPHSIISLTLTTDLCDDGCCLHFTDE